jgi:hypothetical protein
MRFLQRLLVYLTTQILLHSDLCSPSPPINARAEPLRQPGEGDWPDDGAEGDGPQGDEIGFCTEYTRSRAIARTGRVVGDLEDEDLADRAKEGQLGARSMDFGGLRAAAEGKHFTPISPRATRAIPRKAPAGNVPLLNSSALVAAAPSSLRRCRLPSPRSAFVEGSKDIGRSLEPSGEAAGEGEAKASTARMARPTSSLPSVMSMA